MEAGSFVHHACHVQLQISSILKSGSHQQSSTAQKRCVCNLLGKLHKVLDTRSLSFSLLEGNQLIFEVHDCIIKSTVRI